MPGATNYGIGNILTSPAFDSAGIQILDVRLAIGGSVVTVAGANDFKCSLNGTAGLGGAVNTYNSPQYSPNPATSATQNPSCRVTTVDFDVQTANIIVTWDGSTPSGTNGHIFYAGNQYSVNYKMWVAMKFIQQSSAAVIQASAMQV